MRIWVGEPEDLDKERLEYLANLAQKSIEFLEAQAREVKRHLLGEEDDFVIGTKYLDNEQRSA
jgi:hypothetical protein